MTYIMHLFGKKREGKKMKKKVKKKGTIFRGAS